MADVKQTQLIFSASAGDYADASKPRLATGPEGSLQVLRYTAPDIVGTAGQLIEGGAVAEAIALPPDVDTRRGQLTVQLDPSLAAGMRDGLDYLEHFEYECTEQTVSRFLPNLLTYRALQSLDIDNPELAERCPAWSRRGWTSSISGRTPTAAGAGGTGRGPATRTSAAYVVFALVKAREDASRWRGCAGPGPGLSAAAIQDRGDLREHATPTSRPGCSTCWRRLGNCAGEKSLMIFSRAPG